MITISLKQEEWQAVVNVLAQAPFNVVAPLIEQIRAQASQGAQMPRPNGHDEIRPS